MNPSLKSRPLFLAKPPPLKIRNRSSPRLVKLWLAPPFFTESCFMKPIVRYHEIIVFHQDLKTSESSDKKMLVSFHFNT